MKDEKIEKINIYQNILSAIQKNKAVILLTKIAGQEGNVKDFKKKLIFEEELVMMEEKDDKALLEKEFKGQLLNILKEGKPGIIKIPEVMLAEPFYPTERLIVLGGGHIALPLVEIAVKVGFDVTVVDDRPSFSNSGRFPAATRTICESFEHCFDQIGLTRNDYVVIITRGHKHDADCLRQLLQRPETVYVGMIGSRKRVAIVKQQLIDEGFDAERIERICTPIGLAIGAATPEEISVSIVAELIKRKRLDISENCMVNRSDFEMEMLNVLAQQQIEGEQVLDQKKGCCLVTIVDTIGSVPRGKGAKMLVYPTGAITGSIGGGCSESAIMYDAIQLIGTGKWMMKEIDMSATAEEEGMVCGGKMKVLLEDLPFC